MHPDRAQHNELEMMLAGKRPMAIFYRAVGERFDEKDGQPFDKYVKEGRIKKLAFFVKNEKQDFRIYYTIYTLPGEEWRGDLFKVLTRAGRYKWSEKMEAVECSLFTL